MELETLTGSGTEFFIYARKNSKLMNLYKKINNEDIIITKLMFNKLSKEEQNKFILMTEEERIESINCLTIPGSKYGM